MLVVELTTSENTIKINSVKAVVGRDTCSRLFCVYGGHATSGQLDHKL